MKRLGVPGDLGEDRVFRFSLHLGVPTAIAMQSYFATDPIPPVVQVGQGEQVKYTFPAR